MQLLSDIGEVHDEPILEWRDSLVSRVHKALEVRKFLVIHNFFMQVSKAIDFCIGLQLVDLDVMIVFLRWLISVE